MNGTPTYVQSRTGIPAILGKYSGKSPIELGEIE